MNPVYIEVSASVRYLEDAIINGVTDDDGKLTPFKNGNFWCTGDNGYGDYIIMKIHAHGMVKKWSNPAIEFACDCDEKDEGQYRWKNPEQEGGAA